ncbi:hypothetical protein LX36DRAFT_224326 [Colletotrichum falcatum]|nr:hypothetical protein LX36DRAFT_224326 [Colletotrichum falcatum]
MAKSPPQHADASNAVRIVGVVGVFHFIALAFVFLRIYARVIILRVFRSEDALILVTAALALTAWICLILQVPRGLGQHFQTTTTEERVEFERITFWKTVISDNVAMGLLRISVAISLLRLDNVMKWYRWSLYGVIGFVVAYSIQSIVWQFVYCTPLSGWWEFQWMNPFDSRCRDFNLFLDLAYWNISCNVFVDVCLGSLPIPIIWNLSIQRRVRVYILCILNLGYFSIIMGIFRAVYTLAARGDPDKPFNYGEHFWQNLQLNMGIIAACASFLKPVVGRVLKLDRSTARSKVDTDCHLSDGTPHGAGASRSEYSASREETHGHQPESV